MKITHEQEELMRSMCMERKSNKEIAEVLGISITKVHAWRSRNNLTMDKVDKLLAAQKNQELLEYCNTVNHDPVLLSILDSCEWQLENVVSYIVDVLEAGNLCKHCTSYNDPGATDCTLTACGVAAVSYIRAKVGEGS